MRQRVYLDGMAKKKNPAAVAMARLRMVKLTPERRKEISTLANEARAEKLSPKRRSEIARKAAAARWAKAKKEARTK